MTFYISHGCSCDKADNGFLKLECKTGTCENCDIHPMHDLAAYEGPEIDIRFHQFVVDTCMYTSKKGEQKQ